MAGEFGDLLNLDFGVGSLDTGSSNLDVGTTMPPASMGSGGDTGGFNFGDLAKNVGTGVKDVIQPVADIGKAVSPLVGLGTAGMGLAAGIQGAKTSAENAKINRGALDLQRQIASQQQAAAQPLTQFGSETLHRAEAGQIPPAIQAQIDVWKQGALQKARDYAARAGQGDSMMLRQWEDYIEQQAQAMGAQYLMEQQQQGVNALGQGAQALGGAGHTAGNVQANTENQMGSIASLMEQANKALASLSAGAA